MINSLKIKYKDIYENISSILNINSNQIEKTIELLKDNTVPFISRYRKEITGNLNEVQIRAIKDEFAYRENLENRKIEIIKKIFELNKLTDLLYQNILKCKTLTEVEEIYAPYKKKRKTKAMIAIEKGLSSLADYMENNSYIDEKAKDFINIENGIENTEQAIEGAMYIIAERISQNTDIRQRVRDFIYNEGVFVISGEKEDASDSVYKMYYDYKENIKTIKHHRILAINRGEKEKELNVKLDFDSENIIQIILDDFNIRNSYYKIAIIDGLKRLLFKSVIREIRKDMNDKAEKHAIEVFAKNVFNLLMQPPIRKSKVLAIDPGIRTGSKCVIIDKNGKYITNFKIFQNKEEQSKGILSDYIEKYKIDIIAIGNGTGSFEVQEIVSKIISDNKLNVKYTIVSEDGASVYSASPVGTEEFPDLDVTVRGAISIGRRLQDPLAELVKIDPKSIGVGLYQHDVNQKQLSIKLDEVIESVVNKVGVNLNTASYHLLKYISGITPTIAKSIVKYREKNGEIKSRKELLKVSGFGEKTFEQCAGFIKIPESEEFLDNTWVHPENYDIARELIVYNKEKNKDLLEKIKQKYNISDITINDILEELNKPNRDPRDEYPKPILQDSVIKFENLKIGMTVKGKVKNVVDFGAFIDIGIKENALLHISQISDKYIKNINDIIKVGDVFTFTIIDIDSVRKRISVSLLKNN